MQSEKHKRAQSSVGESAESVATEEFEPPAPENPFIEQMLEGLMRRFSGGARQFYLKPAEYRLPADERRMLQARRAAADFEARYADAASRRSLLRMGTGFGLAFALLATLAATGVLPLVAAGPIAGLLLGTLPILVLDILQRRSLLRAIHERLPNSGLAERLALGDDALLEIHDYGVQPFALLGLGGPQRSVKHMLKLLCYNLDWYLAPPRPLLRVSWLSLPLVAIMICLLPLLGSHGLPPPTSDAMALIFSMVMFLIISLSSIGALDASRNQMATTFLLLHFDERFGQAAKE